jgi:hypothetical protein
MKNLLLVFKNVHCILQKIKYGPRLKEVRFFRIQKQGFKTLKNTENKYSGKYVCILQGVKLQYRIPYILGYTKKNSDNKGLGCLLFTFLGATLL